MALSIQQQLDLLNGRLQAALAAIATLVVCVEEEAGGAQEDVREALDQIEASLYATAPSDELLDGFRQAKELMT
jgi:hypothetical protein